MDRITRTKEELRSSEESWLFILLNRPRLSYVLPTAVYTLCIRFLPRRRFCILPPISILNPTFRLAIRIPRSLTVADQIRERIPASCEQRYDARKYYFRKIRNDDFLKSEGDRKRGATNTTATQRE